MLTKIDKKILAKYFDRRARQEEEEKQPEQPNVDRDPNAPKLISTK